MPKRELKEIEHAALTNHRIVKRADQPYPDVAFRLTTAELPDLIHVSAAPAHKAIVPPVTLLQAYGSLSLTHDPGYKIPYEKLLEQLSQSHPNNLIVLSAVGQKLAASQSPEAKSEAVRQLSRAIQLGSSSPNDYLLLGDLLTRADRVSEGIEVLKKGASMFPSVKEFYQPLADHLMKIGKYSDAANSIQRGLELFPGDTALYALLNKAQQVLLPAAPNGSPPVP